MAQILIRNLVRQLKELQDGSRWFDQCLKDKLDGLTEQEAFAIPAAGVHSVAEQVSHILAWRKECILRYRDGYTDLMNSPEDWKPNTTLQETGWPALKQQLYNSTEDLVALLEGQDDSYLETPYRDTGYNFHDMMDGIIQHDLYHLGQIGVTLKLLSLANRR